MKKFVKFIASFLAVSIIISTITIQSFAANMCGEHGSSAHKYSEWVTIVYPTCVSNGTQSKVCEVCGDRVESSINKLSHSIKYVAMEDPTCTKSGHRAFYYCELCLNIFSSETNAKYNITSKYENFKLAPEGHSLYETGSFENYCTEGAGYIYSCENCDYETRFTYSPPTGHVPVKSDKEISATCSESGMKSGTVCRDCKKVLSVGEIIPPKGHNLVFKNKKSATCSEEGYTGDEVCSTCNEVVTKGAVIPKLEHQYVTIKGYSSTCFMAGISDYEICKFCGCIKSEIKILPVTNDHNFETINAVEATCDKIGNIEYQRCKDCGKVFVNGQESSYASIIIPKIDHKTVIKNKKTATTTVKGYTGDECCTLCNKIIKKGIDIDIIQTKKEDIQEDVKIGVPKCSIKGDKKKFTVSYTSVANATGFQVKYTFNGKTKTKTYNTSKSVKKTIKNLKKGKYKVQVRAFSSGKKYYSGWTKVKTITVK